MRTAGTDFNTALTQGVTTLCRLWRVTPLRGTTLYYTDHDVDIPFDGHTYIADKSFEASAIEEATGTGKTNFEITVLLTGTITKADVENSIYSGALVEVDAIFFDHPDYGVMPLASGLIVDATVPYKTQAVFNCSGFASTAQHYLTENYSPTCRAEFCDARCTLTEADFTDDLTVTTVDSIMVFHASGITGTAGFYNLGYIRWLTGPNAGIKSDVQSSTGDTVRLLIKPPFQVEVGDTGQIVQGCDKTITTCTNTFDNAVNFRGEPYVPGSDYVQAPAKKVITGPAAAKPPVLPDGTYYA